MGEADPIVKEVLLEGTPDEIFPYLTESDHSIQWVEHEIYRRDNGKIKEFWALGGPEVG